MYSLSVLLAVFQSTPPVKAATALFAPRLSNTAISIHAAREGGDASQTLWREPPTDFNPRRP